MRVKRWIEPRIRNHRMQLRVSRDIIMDGDKTRPTMKAVFEWDGTWWTRVEECSFDWLTCELDPLELELRDLVALEEYLSKQRIYVSTDSDEEAEHEKHGD